MEFEGQFFRSLDLQLAAQEQYGSAAALTSTGEHLYQWKVQVGKELKDIDVKLAVANQYGSGWSLVAAGVHLYDWRALHFKEPDYVVLPVMLIASDKFFDIAGVRRGLDRFRSVLGRTQDWYTSRVIDARFRLLQPLVIPTNLTSAQWNETSNMTQQDEHRYALLDAAINAYGEQLPTPRKDLRVVLAPYTGESDDIWLGAAASGRYVVVPPRATSVDCPPTGPLDSQCADAAYAVGHELGHAFNLGHSCEVYAGNPRCGSSIMQSSKPPDAILLGHEICSLLKSPFFHPLGAISVPARMKGVCVLGPIKPTEQENSP